MLNIFKQNGFISKYSFFVLSKAIKSTANILKIMLVQNKHLLIIVNCLVMCLFMVKTLWVPKNTEFYLNFLYSFFFYYSRYFFFKKIKLNQTSLKMNSHLLFFPNNIAKFEKKFKLSLLSYFKKLNSIKSFFNQTYCCFIF